MSSLKQYKTARRLGARIFPKTENPKFTLTKPMRAQRKHPSSMTEYGLQLLEKQKARYSYNLNERQFGTYAKAAISKKGVNPAEFLYKNLESRLDNVVYRLGFAKTRPYARQAVSHGHIMVNGRRVNIPSFSVKAGDVITIRPQSAGKGLFKGLEDRLKEYHTPGWLTLDAAQRKGTVSGSPSLTEDMSGIFNLGSVIEFYSR